MLQNVSGDGGQPSASLLSRNPGLCGLRPLSDAGLAESFMAALLLLCSFWPFCAVAESKRTATIV